MRAQWTAAAALVCLAGCRSPTQIDVSVSTNVLCPRVSGTAITTGTLGEIESIPATTTTQSCVDEYIGSVVLVPSGDDQALVGFKVVTAINGQSIDDCAPGDAGSYGPNCIVARRALRYVPHTPLTVNVLMSQACAGVTCDSQSTCVEGACVSATIGNAGQCDDGCSEGVLGQGDAGAPDATVNDAGSVNGSITDAEIPDAITDSAPDAPGPPGIDGAVPGCDMRGLQAGAVWPMEGYCPSGRARSPLVGPTKQPAHHWSVHLPNGSASAPSVGADGTVYIAATGGLVEAVQPSDGGIVWSAMPFGDAGAIWSMPVLAADDTVRVFNYSSGGYAVLSLDGGVLLTNENINGVRGGVTIGGSGTTYVADTNGYLDALTPEGGTIFQIPFGWDFTFPSVAASGVIFSNDNGGDVFGVFPDGGVSWQRLYDAGSAGMSTPQIAPDGTLRAYSYDDGLYSLDPASGKILWQVQLVPGGAGDMHAIAIGDDGTTYVGTTDGLFAYQGQDGGAFCSSVEVGVNEFVIDAVGAVYATTGNGTLAYFAPGCDYQWEAPIPEFATYGSVSDTPVIAPGGVVYVPLYADDAGALEALVP